MELARNHVSAGLFAITRTRIDQSNVLDQAKRLHNILLCLSAISSVLSMSDKWLRLYESEFKERLRVLYRFAVVILPNCREKFFKGTNLFVDAEGNAQSTDIVLILAI